MSTIHAVAAVTASLRALLTPAVAIVPGAEVTHGRPDARARSAPARGVNIFLYMVRPCPHLAADQLPTRRPDGTIVEPATEALDLHYLLSFYGDDAQYEPQLLLGATVAALRARPVITPALVRDARQASPLAIGRSDLEQQRPVVRVVHQPLSLEEMSRIWGTLIQTPYLPSVGCLCSGVIVEERRGPEAPGPEAIHLERAPKP